ncbi:MAG: hypothetical protein OJF50_006741 [Nitrospira sp.]|nr:hypothetical protein [Nitrospira sp.]
MWKGFREVWFRERDRKDSYARRRQRARGARKTGGSKRYLKRGVDLRAGLTQECLKQTERVGIRGEFGGIKDGCAAGFDLSGFLILPEGGDLELTGFWVVGDQEFVRGGRARLFGLPVGSAAVAAGLWLNESGWHDGNLRGSRIGIKTSASLVSLDRQAALP